VDPLADSHAGSHGDFGVAWHAQRGGWWVTFANGAAPVGPFHTSQAAFGAAKDAIDQLIAEGR